MKLIISLFWLVFLLAPSAWGQKLVDVSPTGVVKMRGWVIPYLKKFPEGDRVRLMTIDRVGEHTLYGTEISLKGGRVLLWDAAYYNLENGARNLHSNPIAAKSITRLDLDGKVFAYVTYGTGVAITKFRHPRANSTFIFLGCEMGYSYYDLDGNGKFELLSTSNQLQGANIYLPPWLFEHSKQVPSNASGVRGSKRLPRTRLSATALKK